MKLIKNLLTEEIPESDIVPDELEHMKILLEGLQQHIKDIEKYKSFLIKNKIFDNIENIKYNIEKITKEVNNI